MQILKILFKNAFRHKLRTGLTILSITIALLAFGLLRTVVNAWYAGVEASSAYRLVTRNAVSIIFSLPLSYKERIRQVDGVSEVSWGNWFGGIYIDEKNFFANFAVDAKTYFDLYREYVIPDDQKIAFFRDRKGFVAGRKLAQRFGWKIGDTIVLKGTIYPGNWEFVLRGIYRGREPNADETVFMFHWDYLNESLKKTAPTRADQVGFYMIGIQDPARAISVSGNIDGLFKNSFAETITETEKAFTLGFVAMSDTIITAIELVSFVVIIIILAVVANTVAMSVRERTNEYAVFKTLGFGGWRIAGLILGESIVITMMGCVVGIAATFPAAAAFAAAMGAYFPVFNVEATTIWLDIVFCLAVGLLAAIIPVYRTLKVKIADGLRMIE
ncbi:MAG TPA: ABC transporter ATP-binding protein [Deltaproteobacteria bacterium]|nr:ABC transporter ATP-binding protein [Deltaproteobacteria bacterium]